MISKSKGVWIISLLLVAYGSFTFWLVFSKDSAWFLLWTAACFIAAGGLLFSRAWSRYWVTLVASFTALGWAAFVATIAMKGWPYGMRDTLYVVGHGTLLISTCALSTVYVYRHFRSARQQTQV